MQKIVILTLSIIFFSSCSKEDNITNRNPNLANIQFNVKLNTNLPQYSELKFAGNAVYVANAGNRGVFVVNTGTGTRAWEAADPNHPIQDCSTMKLNGIEVTCPCENTIYNLYTGQARGEDKRYPLLEYRTSTSGNIITITD
ncbi:Rieske (2Fe-2S) protein [Flavimarina sp. Hel_I_48]|uniref:Rieske (2Fe-2S) protein n=1 Tax=Flavimarina sp. Hel_I_48 TaxID=1392488 RepID=UPI0004DEF84E|nr:hypothetical protein [Flavimarina sp. Hel_I_48]